MKYIDKYFKNETSNIGFLELKKGSYIDVNTYKIKDVPLPILTENLVDDIYKGNIYEEIQLDKIVEGIIYILGTDKEFPYKDIYMEILLAYNSNIEEYILYENLEYMKKKQWTQSGIWLRSLLIINPKNIDGLFNYGIVLEEIGREFINKGKGKEGENFIKSSTNQFESILEIDGEYSLAHYKLGFHYKYSERYVKANLIWKKFLTLNSNEVLLQEIREEIDRIRDDVYFELGLTYINYNNFEKALDAFMKLLPKHKKSWNVNYLIGQSYKGSGEYETAVDYLNNAIELNEKEADLYNELGVLYFNMNQIANSLEVFTKGIKKGLEDYRLFFNRGLAYAQLDKYKESLNDINKAYEMNPEDDTIKEQKSALENILWNL